MTEQAPHTHDYREEALAEDPSVSKEASEKTQLRLEGQNQNITTPPKDIQQEHAEIAAKEADLMMGIEDAS